MELKELSEKELREFMFQYKQACRLVHDFLLIENQEMPVRWIVRAFRHCFTPDQVLSLLRTLEDCGHIKRRDGIFISLDRDGIRSLANRN